MDRRYRIPDDASRSSYDSLESGHTANRSLSDWRPRCWWRSTDALRQRVEGEGALRMGAHGAARVDPHGSFGRVHSDRRLALCRVWRHVWRCLCRTRTESFVSRSPTPADVNSDLGRLPLLLLSRGNSAANRFQTARLVEVVDSHTMLDDHGPLNQ